MSQLQELNIRRFDEEMQSPTKMIRFRGEIIKTSRQRREVEVEAEAEHSGSRSRNQSVQIELSFRACDQHIIQSKGLEQYFSFVRYIHGDSARPVHVSCHTSERQQSKGHDLTDNARRGKQARLFTRVSIRAIRLVVVCASVSSLRCQTLIFLEPCVPVLQPSSTLPNDVR
jgi:hypothetical protein